MDRDLKIEGFFQNIGGVKRRGRSGTTIDQCNKGRCGG